MPGDTGADAGDSRPPSALDAVSSMNVPADDCSERGALSDASELSDCRGDVGSDSVPGASARSWRLRALLLFLRRAAGGDTGST